MRTRKSHHEVGSGIGRFGGKAGVAEFSDLRWITVQLGPRHYRF